MNALDPRAECATCRHYPAYHVEPGDSGRHPCRAWNPDAPDAECPCAAWRAPVAPKNEGVKPWGHERKDLQD